MLSFVWVLGSKLGSSGLSSQPLVMLFKETCSVLFLEGSFPDALRALSPLAFPGWRSVDQRA